MSSQQRQRLEAELALAQKNIAELRVKLSNLKDESIACTNLLRINETVASRAREALSPTRQR